MGIMGAKRYLEPFKKTYGRKKPVDLDRLNLIREKLVEEVHPLYEVLKDRDKKVKDYVRALYDLGIRLNVWEKLEEWKNSFKEQDQPLMVKEYEQIYRIVMEYI